MKYRKTLVYVMVVTHLFAGLISAKLAVPLETPEKFDSDITNTWIKMERKLKDMAKSLVKLVLPTIVDSASSLNLSSQCMGENMLLLNGLRNLKPWAVRFVDSSGKTIDGVLSGSIIAMGAYDECIETIATNKGKSLFKGQYCSVDFKPPLPAQRKFYKMDEIVEELKNFSEADTIIKDLAVSSSFFYAYSFRVGVCVPSGCSLDDVNKLANYVADYLYFQAKAVRCELKAENEYTAPIIFAICCFSIAGILLAVGSLLDIYSYYKNVACTSKLARILLAFSLITNYQKFISTTERSDTVTCLHGLKFFSMTWIILGHSYFFLNYQSVSELFKVRDMAKNFAFQAVINATFAVDTFFVIGGLLVCYMTIKYVKFENHPLSISLYIFHRLWRILPVYIFLIMFTFLVSFFGSGPIWGGMTSKRLKACADNWWQNLLFFSNYMNPDQTCLPHTWYLAADFQLYIGALAILLPLLRWPAVGITLSCLIVLGCMLYVATVTYIYNFPPIMLSVYFDERALHDYWTYIYFTPFAHAGPYCIGMMTGYMLAVKPDLKISPRLQVIGWSSAFITCFSVIFGVVEWNRGTDPTILETLFYSGFSRTAWGLGIAWMILCCATGHGGALDSFLSSKVFVPLSRLTYLAYLIHIIVLFCFIGSLHNKLQCSHFLVVWIFFGNLCVSYLTAFAANMLIEAPFCSLEKIIMPNKKLNADFPENNNNNQTKVTNSKPEIIVVNESINSFSPEMDSMSKL